MRQRTTLKGQRKQLSHLRTGMHLENHSVVQQQRLTMESVRRCAIEV
jgi:hypothetical protein